MKKININVHVVLVLGSVFFGYFLTLAYYETSIPSLLRILLSIFMLPLIITETAFNYFQINQNVLEDFPLVFVMNFLTLLLIAYIIAILTVSIQAKKRKREQEEGNY